MRHTFQLALLALTLATIGCSGSTSASDASASPDSGAPTPDAFAADVAVSSTDAASASDSPPPSDTGPASGACTNSADAAIASGSTFPMSLQNCAQTTFGAEPALMNCVVGLGLTSPCAACFDQQVHCTIMHCIAQCSGGNSTQCTMCRATYCDAAYTACSGRAP